MHNVFESRSSRVRDYDNHAASSFRRPSDEDEDEVNPPEVLYILPSFFFNIVSPPLLGY